MMKKKKPYKLPARAVAHYARQDRAVAILFKEGYTIAEIGRLMRRSHASVTMALQKAIK